MCCVLVVNKLQVVITGMVTRAKMHRCRCAIGEQAGRAQNKRREPQTKREEGEGRREGKESVCAEGKCNEQACRERGCVMLTTSESLNGRAKHIASLANHPERGAQDGASRGCSSPDGRGGRRFPTDHVKNAISLSRLLSSSSIKCAWCKILPRECIVGATGCRGRSPTPVVRPCRGTDSPPPALMPGNEDGGARCCWVYEGEAGRCDASYSFERFTGRCCGCCCEVEGSMLERGRTWSFAANPPANARRRFDMDDAPRALCELSTVADFFPNKLNDLRLACISAACSAVCTLCGRGRTTAARGTVCAGIPPAPNSPSSESSSSSDADVDCTPPTLASRSSDSLNDSSIEDCMSPPTPAPPARYFFVPARA
ncbi:hypothetical protein C8Q73DRAFT_671672 [Cubamyces lactineus]|nr:hypothetical protein C8Q73DRAFT_671672 [Cubamyces lactineus]